LKSCSASTVPKKALFDKIWKLLFGKDVPPGKKEK
jgi:hypothetical protein